MSSRLQQLEEMLKNEPDDSFLNYALALELAKTGNIKKAIELIETLLLKDKNYLGAYYQLGNYYEQTKQPEKAIATYKNGMMIAEKNKDKKTLAELNQALLTLQEED